MNLVDTPEGLQDPTTWRPTGLFPVTKPADALEAGDKIAISFAGYADLIGEVVNVIPRDDGHLDVTTDQGISTVLKAGGDILTYPNHKSGTVL